MAYQISDRKLAGSIYKSYRKCGKINCYCNAVKNYKLSHPYYYLEYTEQVNGKWKRRNIYVKKSRVKSLRAKIKYYKAKDKLRKKNYNLFISKITPIIKHFEDNPFNDEAWKSLNLLAQMIPQPAKLIVTFQQQITIMICFIKLTNALQPYLDFISAELSLLEELHNDILDNVRFLRQLLNDPYYSNNFTPDLSLDLWKY